MKLISLKDWLFGLLLVIATLAAYQPAWHGKPIWDDRAHVTPPELRSLDGLGRIWTHVGATQQYYPLAFSAFWVQHRLWGDATLGYHVVNILLHCISALLFLMILRRLEVPGAYLAAAIFALHPVLVESVAWMTQLKNTLSCVLYLGSALAYLAFDRHRSRRLYALALLLFLLALLSKTAVVTLPAGLLVVLWWKRGRLSLRKDVVPLLPFFCAAFFAGLLTVSLEQSVYGARGKYFQFSLIERCVIAGRAVWFHLGKLLWPTHLLFMYPRWQINSAVWWQYLYPLGALVLVSSAWALRKRSRGPLAALLLFGGTLFPTLGFFNASTFRYSFVNDHHQYLACLGIIALVSAGLAVAAGKLPAESPGHLPSGKGPGSSPPSSTAGNMPARPARHGLVVRTCYSTLALLLVSTLATLTWRQCRMYADAETLWRTTLAGNPACYLGWENLGSILLHRGQPDDAIACFHKALDLCPDYPECHNDLGLALSREGQTKEAIAEFRKALEYGPNLVEAHVNLGNTLAEQGQVDEAIAQYYWALAVEPQNGRICANLGHALFQQGKLEEAAGKFQQAIDLQPSCAPAHEDLGLVLLQQGRVDEAVRQFQEALQCEPDFADARKGLADAYLKQGASDKAILELSKLLRANPNDAGAHCSIAVALSAEGRAREAIEHYRAALQTQPNLPEALNNLAWILAANPDAGLRNGGEAVVLAERACKLTDYRQPMMVGTLAAACAEAGRFADAVAMAEKAAVLAEQVHDPELAARNRQLLKLYREGQTCRQSAQHGVVAP